MLIAETNNLGFACTLYVKCRHGNHGFTMEPPRVPFREMKTGSDNQMQGVTAETFLSMTESTNETTMDPNLMSTIGPEDDDADTIQDTEELSYLTTENSIGENSDNIVEQSPIKKAGRPPKTHKAEDYAINYQAYLMMQLFGNGISGIDTMLGMLGIAVHSGSHGSWDAIANRLGVAQQKVADVVQNQNLTNEIEEMKKLGIQQVKDKGKDIWPLTCTYDMGWQKRASGNSYNSQSGHGFLVGCYTNKVIDRVCYSRGCRSCLNYWEKMV